MIAVINKIASLLKSSEEKFWLSYFNHVLEELNKGQDEKCLCNSILKAFQGGMGSLNDFVLHKDGKPLIEENNHLDALKDQLFDICMAVKDHRS
jgi:hypothetical protein